MQILRVTRFRWGAYINNWYRDLAAVKRQLDTEKGRVESKDITHTEWYRVEQMDITKEIESTREGQ